MHVEHADRRVGERVLGKGGSTCQAGRLSIFAMSDTVNDQRAETRAIDSQMPDVAAGRIVLQ